MKKLLGSLFIFFSIYLYSSDLSGELYLDEKDSYPTSAFDLSSFISYIYGSLFFVAGFLVSKFELLRYLKKESTFNPMIKKIESSKDEKALLKLLLSSNKKEYKPYIKQLEESIYEQKKLDFRKLKDELSKL
jgi:hypothetical protein